MRRDSPYVSQYNKSIPFVKLKLLFCLTIVTKDALFGIEAARVSVAEYLFVPRFCSVSVPAYSIWNDVGTHMPKKYTVSGACMLCFHFLLSRFCKKNVIFSIIYRI